MGAIYEELLTLNKNQKMAKVASSIKSSKSDNLNDLKCKSCSKVMPAAEMLRIHELLHEDLTYFFCDSCPFLFGLPSKLRTHLFMTHGKVLDRENVGDLVCDMSKRIENTTIVLMYLMGRFARTTDQNILEI